MTHGSAPTNVATLKGEMKHFNELFKQLDDDQEDFDEEVTKISRMNLDSYVDYLERRASTPYGRIFAAFREFVIKELLPSYMLSSISERASLLLCVAENRFALITLWTLLGEYQSRLQKCSPQDKPVVLRILLQIAVASEIYLPNFETRIILSNAWEDAQDGGLNPALFFQEAAQIASHNPLPHGESANSILRSFKPYFPGT